MRRKIVYLAAAVFALVPVLFISCGGDANVSLVFNQESANCAAVTQSLAAIQCNDGVITFEGSVLTSDPCYYLTAMVDTMDKSNVVIRITAKSALFGEDAYCVECVGEIAFSGELSPAGSCSKNVSIIYNGATIAEYERK
jgi:hypothetical protein